MATGAVSMGKLMAHARNALPLEPGWAVDGDGAPTVDPAHALSGAISPFGGAKGYGLALAVELLVATLTASALGTAVRGTLDTEPQATKGDLFILVDPAVFGAGEFRSRLEVYLEEVRRTGVIAGEARVSIPGDRSRVARAEGLMHGYTVDGGAWREAQELLRVTRLSGRRE
jgi:LDH2 family malate/lactate/ureidoglycolate dehydrogenase